MSKGQKGILFLLVLVFVGVYFYYFMKNQEDLRAQNYRTKEEELFEKVKEENIRNIGNFIQEAAPKGKKRVWLYYPLNAAGEKIPEVEKQMNEISESLSPKDFSDEHKRIFILAKRTQEAKNLDHYTYHTNAYTWNPKKEKWDEKMKTEKQSLTLNALNAQPLLLGNVFKDDPVNMIRLKNLVRQELLENDDKYKESPEKVFELTNFTPDQTNFQLTPDQLILNFPQNEIGLESLALPYQKLSTILNPDFVAEEFVSDPQPKTLDPNKKYIALTFDDGPSDKTTPKVLDILKSQHVPATFFMLGQQVERFPDLAKRIKEEEHELGDHSYSHPNLVTLSNEEVRQQIENTEIAIYKATGSLPKSVRPPYGSVNGTIAPIISLPIAQWSIDSLDWSSHNAQKITAEIQKNAFNGGIVLMHDIHQETVDALPTVINNLRKDGYEFVTFSQILNEDAVPITAYYSYDDHRIIQ